MNIDPTSALAVFGGFVAFMGFLAAVRKAARGVTSASKFYESLEHIPELRQGQEGILTSIQALSDEVAAAKQQSVVIEEIHQIVVNFNIAIDQMIQNATEMAVTTFKAHTIHCPTASYIISTSDDGFGIFEWANPVWYELHGIDESEAAIGQFWNCVAEEHKARVKAASDAAAASYLEFKVSYTNVNLKTGERTPVEIQAWPLVPYNVKPGDHVKYLGAIKVLSSSI